MTDNEMEITKGRRYLKNWAFFSMKACHFAGTSASIKMADTGHAGSQAPQSVQVAGSMYICG